MLLDDLVEIKAVSFGEFTLTSGKKSKYYVDIKKASSNPTILKKITEKFSNFDITADKVVGVELGAVPLIVAYSLKQNIPFVIIRKKDRLHGKENRFEGEINPGEKIVILEDVITSGGSVISAIDTVEQAGGEVIKVLAVVDRQEGGTESVNCKVSMAALVTAKELLDRSERGS